MAEVVWEDPPAIARTGGRPQKWPGLLSPLMDRPECWARVADFDTPNAARATASNLRHRKVHIPDGVWEFVARGKTVYGRYLGRAS